MELIITVSVAVAIVFFVFMLVAIPRFMYKKTRSGLRYARRTITRSAHVITSAR